VKTFAGKTALFLLPFSLLLGVPIAVLICARELVPVRGIVEQQAREATLYGVAYSYPIKFFKLLGVTRFNPKTLMLGSSRVMQFRSVFFSEPDAFYNAGGAAVLTAELGRFVSRVSADSRLTLLIVGLDQWWFNPDLDGQRSVHLDAEYTTDNEPFNVIQRHWFTVWKDVFLGKITASILFARPPYPWAGLLALAHHSGFMRDGSFYDGGIVNGHPAPGDPEFESRETLARLAQASDLYRWQTRISPYAVEEVGRFLDYCSARNLVVVGFLPPFAPRVARRLFESRHYPYIFELSRVLAPLFEAHGQALFDFTDGAALGATDAEFIDGVHGSDKVALRMLIAMASGEPRLAARVNVAALRQRLEETTTNYVVVER
jgi:hypothetical protein